MTDLTQAIAELRKQTKDDPWVAVDFEDRPYLAEQLADVLNAAVSGDLIPRADHNLALALMVEKAAGVAEADRLALLHQASLAMDEGFDTAADFDRERADTAIQICNAIRALAPTDALAELQALRDANEQLQVMAAEEQRARKAAEAEIATLRAQVERLTGALRFYADFHENPNDGPWGVNSQDFGKAARAALTEGAKP